MNKTEVIKIITEKLPENKDCNIRVVTDLNNNILKIMIKTVEE